MSKNYQMVQKIIKRDEENQKTPKYPNMFVQNNFHNFLYMCPCVKSQALAEHSADMMKTLHLQAPQTYFHSINLVTRNGFKIVCRKSLLCSSEHARSTELFDSNCLLFVLQ